MVPKGFRTDIKITPTKIGVERREELYDDIANKQGFLPKGISEEDMDESFVEFINNDLEIIADGVKVPVIFLTIQRWSEFSKTWNFSDIHKDIKIPFITIVRRPDIQIGQNQAGYFNIPGKRTYTYMKVPTWDGVRKGVDLYKIPQPVPVDITYEVRLFTNKMKDLNKFNSIIHKAFQSRQYYIDVNRHPIPIHLESISDESNIDDFESRRFYVQLFEMVMLGYIMDEDDFEVIPTINRVYTFIELDEGKQFKNVILEPNIKANTATYTIVFKPMAEDKMSFIAKYDINFTQITNIEEISRITILVNGVGIFDGLILTTPLRIKSNDQVIIKIKKRNSTTGKFQLVGNVL